MVITGMLIYCLTSISNLRVRLTEAAEKKAELTELIDERRTENAALSFAVERKDDPEMLKEIAREKCGLVMPDEIIFYDSGEAEEP